MTRPFRFHPPALIAGAMVRDRLLDRLALRWDRRLTSVVGGPGFGKTVLLTMALQRKAGEGRDIWLSCEPGDVDADHLIAGLAATLDLDEGATLEDLLRTVWMKAPLPVCFVLDDVHEVSPGSGGADVLARLVAELPRNAHLVLASRESVPVPTARLAASGELERIIEDELMFDGIELKAFAAVRGVDVDLLSSSGGWPALAELGASARADLVVEYLWDEVLAAIGPHRARGVACLSVVGRADDRIAVAIAPGCTGVDDLVADLPLVARTTAGWASLHPLWAPPLRRIITPDEADEARRSAAMVHRDAGSFPAAVDLLCDAGAWTELLGMIRHVAIQPGMRMDAAVFGSCYRALPIEYRRTPEALLANGLAMLAGAPLDAVPVFIDAAAGFREVGDVEAEVAVIRNEGLIRWWSNDVAGLFDLYQRAVELAAAGSESAAMVVAIGDGAIAHLGGDSDGTLRALAGVDLGLAGGWAASIAWLRHVAHRRRTDLVRAELELVRVQQVLTAPESDPQLDLARARMDWLEGRVDGVCDRLAAIEAYYEVAPNRYLRTEVALELAARLAYVGEPDSALRLVDEVEPLMADTPGPLAPVLRLIARAAIAVDQGDEAAATDLLADDPLTAADRPDSWYWPDRAALCLLHVLAPTRRAEWDARPLPRLHLVGLELAHALVGARDDDLTIVGALAWPEPGLVRAHLPVPWIAELVAGGRAAGNPAPDALTETLGDRLRPALRNIAGSRSRGSRPRASPSTQLAEAAAHMLSAMPAVPEYTLSISVLGPLDVRRNGVPVDQPDLRRHRVRELLCYLVAEPRARRDAVADALWPERADPRHNLRVTLNYLQGVLQPERLRSDPPYFLQTKGDWLVLHRDDERLRIDAWELDRLLAVAATAERNLDPSAASAAYLACLPLWRGDPFVDVVDSDWVQVERSHRRTRFTEAAQRGGQLALAQDAYDQARHAAERALAADPTSEAAYQLLVSACLGADDLVGARYALADCQRALAELDVRPDATTQRLMATVEGWRSSEPGPLAGSAPSGRPRDATRE